MVVAESKNAKGGIEFPVFNPIQLTCRYSEQISLRCYLRRGLAYQQTTMGPQWRVDFSLDRMTFRKS